MESAAERCGSTLCPTVNERTQPAFPDGPPATPVPLIMVSPVPCTVHGTDPGGKLYFLKGWLSSWRGTVGANPGPHHCSTGMPIFLFLLS